MFLNYPLEERLQPYVGVDVSELIKKENVKVRWERWVRALMGFRASPYICIRGQYWIEEVILGDRRSASNPYKWSRVVLNIPGSDKYDPMMPWVYKWDDEASAIAGDTTNFVDDGRTTENSEEHEVRVSRRFSSLVNYHGSQYAPRKRRKSSQTNNVSWTGSII